MDIIHSFNGGADTNYTLARLERDRPDLHAQVMGGALSANSAAVVAGFRTRTMSIPLDPDRAARAILRRIFGTTRMG
jgi:hypothetical protein